MVENKDAGQLRGYREADLRLCFSYMDSTLPVLLKSELLNFSPSSEMEKTSLGITCSEPHCLFSHEAAHKILLYLLFFVNFYASFTIKLGRLSSCYSGIL